MHETLPAKQDTTPERQVPTAQDKPAYEEAAAALPVWMQPRLEVTPPDDTFEREAEAVANQVMRMPFDDMSNPQTALQRLPLFTLQRQCDCGTCAGCQDDLLLQRQIDEKAYEGVPPQEVDLQFTGGGNVKVQRFATDAAGHVAPPSVHSVLQRPGRALDRNLHDDMATRFGVDFSHVRIHTDSKAARSAGEVQAQAYTVGDQIVFGSGHYAPQTEQGRHLIAHELAHVIQQTGAPHLARGVIAARRLYRKVDRAKYLGTKRHDAIEKELMDVNNDLITEAPIPGATRRGVGINDQGFADLFYSTGNIVPGIRLNFVKRGKKKGSDREISGTSVPGDAQFNENMSAVDTHINDQIITHNMLVNFIRASKRNEAKSKGSITFGPDIVAATQTVSRDFPASANIGEIKPLSDFSVALGLAQINAYQRGLEQFVRVSNFYLGTRASISTDYVTDRQLTIPGGLDYDDFDTQHKTKGTGHVIEKGIGKKPDQRIWIYRLKNGLYVYFPLQHPYLDTTFPQDVDRKILDLDGVLDGLRKRQVTLPRQLSTKRLRNPVVNLSARKPPAGRLRVQRKGPKSKSSGGAQKRDWDKLHKAWEAKRKSWDKGRQTYKTAGGAEDFLQEEARPHIERMEIDDRLGIGSRKGKLGKIDKQLKKIEFWSGTSGKLYGRLRFQFGETFEKIEALIERVKAKLSDIRKKAKTTRSKFSIGWKHKATNLVLEIARVAFREMLSSVFQRLTACINGIMEKAINKLVDEASEEVQQEMKVHREKFEDFRDELEEEYSSEIKTIETFTSNIDDVMETAGILADIVTAIRVGVQIVSCGSPPGLGCLWGLVAQLGITAAMELLTDTDYFKDNIAEPAASSLLNTFMSDAFMNLVITALPPELQDYTSDVAGCKKTTRKSGSGYNSAGGTFNPNAPDVQDARRKFEREHRSDMIDQIKAGLQKTDGNPVTDAEIEALIKKMQDTGNTLDELSEIFKKHTKDHKVDFEGVSGALSGEGEAASGSGTTGGEGGDSGDVTARVVNVDDLPETGTKDGDTSQLRFVVAAKSGHHTNPNKVIHVTVHVKDGDTVLLILKNVPVIVKNRTHYDPDPERNNPEKARYLTVHYWLTRDIPMTFENRPSETLVPDQFLFGWIRLRL